MQQLSYGTYGVLASSGDLSKPPHNLRLDGVGLAEWIQVWQAADATPLARGNLQRTLTLTVPRLFNSPRLAQENFLEHLGELDDAGTLTILCGESGDQSTREAAAVLQNATPELRGLSVIWNYSFLTGPFAAPST